MRIYIFEGVWILTLQSDGFDLGAGGGGASNDGEAVSAGGGAGGEGSQSAQEGGTGTGGEGSTYGGGDPGSAGAAIRRNTGFVVNVTNNGSINGVQNATTVL